MLLKTEVRCALTVRSLMPSRRAICLFASPCPHQPEHLGLARSQVAGRRRRRCARVEQLPGRPRVDRRLPAAHRPDAVEDVLGLGVLEQVADRAGVQRGRRSARRRRTTSAPATSRRLLGDDLPGGLDPVHARHLQVHQHDVGLGLARPPRPPRRRRRPCRPPRCPPAPASSCSSPLRTIAWSSTSTTRIAVRHRRTSSRTVVPAPGADRTSSRPPASRDQARAGRAARVRVGPRGRPGRSRPRRRGPSSAQPVAVDRATWTVRCRRARAAARCGPPPGPPATPARPPRRTRRHAVHLDRGASMPARPPARSGPPERRPASPSASQVGRVDLHQQRPQRRAGWSRSDLAPVLERAARSRAGGGARGPAADSANDVPARSWTTPSCRSRAIRRRSASEASAAAAQQPLALAAGAGRAAGSAPTAAVRRRTSDDQQAAEGDRPERRRDLAGAAWRCRRRSSRPRTAAARPRATGSGCTPRAAPPPLVLEPVLAARSGRRPRPSVPPSLEHASSSSPSGNRSPISRVSSE